MKEHEIVAKIASLTEKARFDLLGAVEGQVGALGGLADDGDFVGVALDDLVSLGLSILCVSKTICYLD